MMDRRAFITMVGGSLLAAPLAGGAQQARVPPLGYLGNSSPSLEENLLAAFRQGLYELGYTEGQNIIIEYRWAEGRYDRFPDLVSDLVRPRLMRWRSRRHDPHERARAPAPGQTTST